MAIGFAKSGNLTTLPTLNDSPLPHPDLSSSPGTHCGSLLPKGGFRMSDTGLAITGRISALLCCLGLHGRPAHLRRRICRAEQRYPYGSLWFSLFPDCASPVFSLDLRVLSCRWFSSGRRDRHKAHRNSPFAGSGISSPGGLEGAQRKIPEVAPSVPPRNPRLVPWLAIFILLAGSIWGLVQLSS